MNYRRIKLLILALLAMNGPAFGRATDQQHGIQEGQLQTPDGRRLYYVRAGSAPRVIIQPGRLFAFEDFAWLAEHFTLISYDMRSRGRSEFEVEDARISLAQDVADLEAVRAHFGIERAAFLGYSYLGKMIVLYALEHPGRAERLVQFGPVAPTLPTEYPARYVNNDDPLDPDALARLRALRTDENYHLTHPREYCVQEWEVVQRPLLVGDPARLDRVRIDVCDMPNEWPILQMRHLRLQFENPYPDLEAHLAALDSLDIPVLTVHGTRDRNAPYGAGREWAWRLPNARLLTVEGAGHHVFSEASETVMPAVLTFLQGDWPAGAERVTEDPRR